MNIRRSEVLEADDLGGLGVGDLEATVRALPAGAGQYLGDLVTVLPGADGAGDALRAGAGGPGADVVGEAVALFPVVGQAQREVAADAGGLDVLDVVAVRA